MFQHLSLFYTKWMIRLILFHCLFVCLSLLFIFFFLAESFDTLGRICCNLVDVWAIWSTHVCNFIFHGNDGSDGVISVKVCLSLTHFVEFHSLERVFNIIKSLYYTRLLYNRLLISLNILMQSTYWCCKNSGETFLDGGG